MAAAGVPTQLGHVALRVSDLARSVQFYRDVIGMTERGGSENKVADRRHGAGRAERAEESGHEARRRKRGEVGGKRRCDRRRTYAA